MQIKYQEKCKHKENHTTKKQQKLLAKRFQIQTGELNRSKLSEKIFQDREAKQKLDNLTKKYVVEKIKQEIKQEKEQDIIIDAPLLFETELDKNCDIIIGVLAKEETKIERICERDGITREQAKRRLQSQKTEDYFKINCTYCITNEKIQILEKEINEILEGKNLSNENIIHIYEDEIEYLQFRKLLKYKEITHCYTLKPLDFNINTIGKEKVDKDYEKICKELNLDSKAIYRPKQTHTNNIEIIEEQPAGIYQIQDIDGLITSQKNKTLSLTFADCICLLFYDPEKNIIANIHSGWRGTYQEIAKTAVQKLKEKYNIKPEKLICAIAPSIRECCFEVDEEVKEMFYEKFKSIGAIEKIIKTTNKNKYYIDTVLINRIILNREGLKNDNIIESKICTKCNSNKLHSYREEKEKSGRNTGIISLK